MRIFVIMSNNVDERNIIFQLQNGDRRAISDFIDTYGKFMYNVTYRILGQVPDAEEATQDAVLKVLKNLLSFDQHSSLKAWCYTIAYRTAIDYKRKVKNHQDITKVDHLISQYNTEETSEISDAKFQINAMMKILDDESKAIVTMYYLEEKNVKEITEFTGLSVSNVKIKLHRARKLMAETFKDIYIIKNE
jgi:RNA polymerase sigma factor (sigma-70 family)